MTKVKKYIGKSIFSFFLVIAILASFTESFSALSSGIENGKSVSISREEINYGSYEAYVDGWRIYGAFNNLMYDSDTGTPIYCLNSKKVAGNSGTATVLENMSYWNNLSWSARNGIGLATYYGYPVNSLNVPSAPAYVATQIVIWEYSLDVRSSGEQISSPWANYLSQHSDVAAAYNNLLAEIRTHATNPILSSNDIVLQGIGNGYAQTITDSTGLAGQMHWTANNDNVKISASGGNLTVWCTDDFSGEVTVSGTKTAHGTGVNGKALISASAITGANQEMIVGVLDDPTIRTSFKVSVNTKGTIEIVKKDTAGNRLSGAIFEATNQATGEKFTIGPTNASGYASAAIQSVPYGTYTVKETVFPTGYTTSGLSTWSITLNSQNPVGSIEVTNVSKYGNLKITKIAEDGIKQGFTFILKGTSKYGDSVFLRATTGNDGIAIFRQVPAGTYMLYEENTPLRYVSPESQTVTISGGSTTTATFKNITRKWHLTVQKKDSTEAAPAGDATLAGAVYGLYNATGDLIQSYTTDSSGRMKIGPHLPGTGYYLKEITAPEGYLADEKKYNLDFCAALENLSDQEISYQEMTVTDEPIKGTVSLTKFGEDPKHPGEYTIPEKDARFYLFSTKYSSYNAAKEKGAETEYDSCIVDDAGNAIWENGTTKSKLLSYGEYKLTQDLHVPYQSINDMTVFISENKKNYHYELTNPLILKMVSLTKVDNDTKQTIINGECKFKLWYVEGERFITSINDQGNESEIFTTTGGVYLFRWTQLPFGNYRIIEIEAPEGYTKQEEAFEFQVNDLYSPVIRVTFENTPLKGVIEIHKKGLQFSDIAKSGSDYGELQKPIFTEEYLSGVEFEIIAAEDIITKDGTIRYRAGSSITHLWTSSGKPTTTSELYLGKYIVREISTIKGYNLDQTDYIVDITNDGSSEISVTPLTIINNRAKTTVTATKKVEQWEDRQQGDIKSRSTVIVPAGSSFVFGIYANQKFTGTDPEKVIEKDSLIAIAETNNEGKIQFTEDLPFGRYYLKELKPADSRYSLNTTQYFFTISEDQIDGTEIHVEPVKGFIRNDIKKFPVTVKKSDINKTQFLPGALLEVKDSQGQILYRNYTDSEGKLYLSLEPGTYTVKEISPPDGYVLNNKEYTFTIDDTGKVTGETVIPNEKTKFIIFKVDPNGSPISGVDFEMRNETGKVISNATSDENGKVVLEGFGKGAYKIYEVKNHGYILPEDSINVTHTGKWDNSASYANTKLVNEEIPGSVFVQKTDDANQYVKGAVYGLFRSKDHVQVRPDGQADPNATFKTNEEGYFEIKGIAWGHYYLQELQAPKGYELDSKKHEITIDRSTAEQTVTIYLKNMREGGSVELTKVDEADESRVLSGAVYTLFRNDGSIYQDNLSTNEAGQIRVDNLPWGSYYFEEKAAPTGYGISDEKIRFSINGITAGKVQQLTATDPQVSCKLKITKKIKATDIVFAHGKPTFIFKIKGTELDNQTSHTYYRSITFDENSLQNSTVEYLEQSVILSELPMGIYAISEEETFRYSLSDNGIFIKSGNGRAYADRAEILLDPAATGCEILFQNDKTKQSGTSHTQQETNILKCQKKYTALVATWNGSQSITSEVLDRTQLDVYAIYDDGSQKKIPDQEYRLTPEIFDSSLNGEYTVKVSYTEDGRERSDTFRLTLTLPDPFTWYVTDETPFTADDGTYYDGTVSIDGYTGKSSVIRFPESVKGIRTWNRNGNHTFTDNGKKYQVTRIGKNVNSTINGISNVTAIELPDTLKEVGNSAFYYSNIGGQLKIPDSVVKIGDSAFDSCNISGNLTIPDSVTSIGAACFYSCGLLDGKLTLSRNLTTIPNQAFFACSFTDTLTIPSRITNIGNEAFRGCDFTGSLFIPYSVQKIGYSAFENCSEFSGGLIIINAISIGDSAFKGCSGFTGSLSICAAETIKEVGSSAFEGCSGFTGNLTIPESLTALGSRAFAGCSGLNGSLTIKNGLSVIEESTFEGCNFSSGITIPESVTRIENRAFCSAFTISGIDEQIIIGNHVTEIGDYAFAENDAWWNSIVIGNRVTDIGSSAFEFNTFDSLSLGNNIKTIGERAFKGNQAVFESLTLPPTLTKIGNSAFENSSFKGNLTIPEGVTMIGEKAFYNSAGDETLTIPSTLKIIAISAFENGNMQNISITNGVEIIQTNAFKNCYNLSNNLSLPGTLTTIGDSAFENCYSLTEFLGSNGLTHIGNRAFAECSDLKGNLAITAKIKTIGNEAFINCGYTGGLLFYTGEESTTIGTRAFYNCAFINSPTIPKTVISIGEDAFFGNHFPSIKIPQSLQTSGDYPFGLDSNPSCLISMYS